MEIWMIFATVAGVVLSIPFLIWGVIRFKSKIQQKFSIHHGKIILFSFIGFSLLAIIFILLAIFVN